MVRFIENTVITTDVYLLLGSEIYLFWLIDLIDCPAACATIGGFNFLDRPSCGFRFLSSIFWHILLIAWHSS